MNIPLLLLEFGEFGTHILSPTVLAQNIVEESNVTSLLVTLSSSSYEQRVDAYGARLIKDGSQSIVAFSLSDENLDELEGSMQIYAWLREQIQKYHIRVLHTFGSGTVDLVAAPLTSEFNLHWFRTATDLKENTLATRYQCINLSTVNWAKPLKNLSIECSQLRAKINSPRQYTVILPPNGYLTLNDLEFAHSLSDDSTSITLLEPCTLGEKLWNKHSKFSDILTLAPDTDAELTALLLLADKCVIPEAGSWLVDFVKRSGCLLKTRNTNSTVYSVNNTATLPYIETCKDFLVV